MNIKKTNETKHQELLALLNPLLDFLTENNYNLFLVAGKDGTCTRHAFGNNDDVAGMIKGMMENNEDIKTLINQVVKQ